ncbi:hypothetical protein PHMEG_00034617 [Phytophthora megakarya]|uniref:CCHC-type domain-containing protein n=1 Tax=Phytophthora megakarya TaxID=4795 RepID=A0A225UT81_9STRA|nr:hypothetical protein PHMEG_00034617 [Phytophthora megakarya]
MSQKNCTHCGSTTHDNLGCWKRLTCQKCGRKGHLSDHCLFVCRACGEMHEPGKSLSWSVVLPVPSRFSWQQVQLHDYIRSKIIILSQTCGCKDDSQKQECVGIGENVYMTEGRTRIKITLAGAYVYYFDAWVRDLSGQEAILGMDFMVPAGIRPDMADGSLCLPDELSGRRQLFSGNSRLVTFDQHHRIPVAGSVEIVIRRSVSDRQKLWVTRGEQWVPTAVKGLGNTQYLRITNVSERPVTLQRDIRVGIWLAGDHVPRMPGFVSIGSQRYTEWQNLALQATAEQQAVDEVVEVTTEPMVDSTNRRPRS